jgi:hypothetical protein
VVLSNPSEKQVKSAHGRRGWIRVSGSSHAPGEEAVAYSQSEFLGIRTLNVSAYQTDLSSVPC